MARPRKVGKKTTIGISEHLVGWLEFAGREYAGGMTEYLMELADADRAARILARTDASRDEYSRYHQYTNATGRPQELDLMSMHSAEKYHARRRQADVWEVRTDDGGVGVKVGGGALHMGYDVHDMERLLGAVLYGVKVPSGDGVETVRDGDLMEAVEPYITGGEAYDARVAELAGLDDPESDSE